MICNNYPKRVILALSGVPVASMETSGFWSFKEAEETDFKFSCLDVNDTATPMVLSELLSVLASGVSTAAVVDRSGVSAVVSGFDVVVLPLFKRETTPLISFLPSVVTLGIISSVSSSIEVSSSAAVSVSVVVSGSISFSDSITVVVVEGTSALVLTITSLLASRSLFKRLGFLSVFFSVDGSEAVVTGTSTAASFSSVTTSVTVTVVTVSTLPALDPPIRLLREPRARLPVFELPRLTSARAPATRLPIKRRAALLGSMVTAISGAVSTSSVTFSVETVISEFDLVSTFTVLSVSTLTSTVASTLDAPTTALLTRLRCLLSRPEIRGLVVVSMFKVFSASALVFPNLKRLLRMFKRRGLLVGLTTSSVVVSTSSVVVSTSSVVVSTSGAVVSTSSVVVVVVCFLENVGLKLTRTLEADFDPTSEVTAKSAEVSTFEPVSAFNEISASDDGTSSDLVIVVVVCFRIKVGLRLMRALPASLDPAAVPTLDAVSTSDEVSVSDVTATSDLVLT